MKKCSKCGKNKPFDSFYKTKRKGGYFSQCKNCLRNRLEIIICIVCGIKFEGKAGRKLCSIECKKAHRPQTFKNCESCGDRFGPVDHLNRKFCSYKCKVTAQKTGRKRKYISSKKARAAQRRIAYALETGKIKKPTICEKCGTKNKKIEAAHYDYNKPMLVRWLCRSCHVKWDKHQPKDTGYSIAI